MRRLSRRDVAVLGLAVLLLSAPPVKAESERSFRIGLLGAATVAEGIDAFVDQMRLSLRYNCRNSGLETVTMTRFLFFVLVERHRVVAPTSARPLAAPVPALQI